MGVSLCSFQLPGSTFLRGGHLPGVWSVVHSGVGVLPHFGGAPYQYPVRIRFSDQAMTVFPAAREGEPPEELSAGEHCEDDIAAAPGHAHHRSLVPLAVGSIHFIVRLGCVVAV